MFIIYHQRAFARHIPRELGVSVIFPKHAARNRVRKNKMSAIVNWGCGKLPTISNDLRVLNADISGALTKVHTFELMRAANLPIPRIVTDVHERIDGVPFYERGKYLARKDKLTGGAGIEICEKGTLPKGAQFDFFSQVVTKAYEVRLHIGSNEIICEQFKFVPQGSKTLIRNYDNGARFSAKSLDLHVDTDVARRGREIAIAAVSACGMDFGAVDMALTKNGNWVIFEVNSAPGLFVRAGDDDHAMPCTYEAYLTYFRSFVL